MRLSETLHYTFGEIRDLTHRVLDGLDGEALTWRPDAAANSVAWLVWHLTRVEDVHVAEIADRQQVWDPSSVEQFGLPAGATDSGYGHTPAQVAALRPDDAAVLLQYQDDVAAMVQEYLRGAAEDSFDRVIDTSYDPPVTVGVRFVSVIGDALQHAGQAAYVRGLFERRGA